MPKKRTFYSEEERKAHHEKKQREADLQIQELTKHWENDPKDIAEYLAFSTQFYKYSSRNTMLIYRQRPDSVFIASYTHWKELGYYVQEGEHGANIYRPETTRYFKPNVPNPTWVLLSKASPEQRHEVEIGMLESRDFTYFKPCTVFDISQTNCPPEAYPKLCGVGYNSTQHKDIYNMNLAGAFPAARLPLCATLSPAGKSAEEYRPELLRPSLPVLPSNTLSLIHI